MGYSAWPPPCFDQYAGDNKTNRARMVAGFSCAAGDCTWSYWPSRASNFFWRNKNNDLVVKLFDGVGSCHVLSRRNVRPNDVRGNDDTKHFHGQNPHTPYHLTFSAY